MEHELRRTSHTATKWHTCSFCGCTIFTHDRYTKIFGKHEWRDRMAVHKACDDCIAPALEPLGDGYDYVRNRLKLPVHRLQRVIMNGKPGIVVRSQGDGQVWVKLRGQKHVVPCHPTWEIAYFDKGKVVADYRTNADLIGRKYRRPDPEDPALIRVVGICPNNHRTHVLVRCHGETWSQPAQYIRAVLDGQMGPETRLDYKWPEPQSTATP